MLIRALPGHRLQRADPLSEDRVLHVDLLADYVADLGREDGVVEPYGPAVVAGAVGDHRHHRCGNVTVVRHRVRPGVTVQFPAGPAPHPLRPGLPAEHDAVLQ